MPCNCNRPEKGPILPRFVKVFNKTDVILTIKSDGEVQNLVAVILPGDTFKIFTDKDVTGYLTYWGETEEIIGKVGAIRFKKNGDIKIKDGNLPWIKVRAFCGNDKTDSKTGFTVPNDPHEEFVPCKMEDGIKVVYKGESPVPEDYQSKITIVNDTSKEIKIRRKDTLETVVPREEVSWTSKENEKILIDVLVAEGPAKGKLHIGPKMGVVVNRGDTEETLVLEVIACAEKADVNATYKQTVNSDDHKIFRKNQFVKGGCITMIFSDELVLDDAC